MATHIAQLSISEVRLLALLLCLAAHLCIAGDTVYIEPSSGPDDRQLRHALQNQSVSKIVFLQDYDVGDQQFEDLNGPGRPVIKVNRNVTMTAAPGQAKPLLNLQLDASVVELCDTCVFNIENLDIARERRGANAQLDFFFGTGNSVINLTNVIRKRLSCTPIGPALRLVESTARAPGFPARNGSKQQVYGEQDIVFRGQSYPRTLHLIDYSASFPRAYYSGGYSLVLHNVFRMCDSFVDAACLEKHDADICVYEHIGQLLGSPVGGGSSSSSSSSSSSRAPGSGGLSTGAVAGIAVAVVLGLVLLAAGLGLLVLRRRRTAAALQAGSIGSSSSKTFRDADLGAKDLEYGRGSIPTTGPNSATGSIPTIVKAASGIDGKDVHLVIHNSSNNKNSNNMEAGQVAVHNTCDLHFGQLLGSGSFGRVYKGRWHGKDVAVKVIEHDSRMAAAVANEVQLMLSCNHTNVVRAYTYITHTPTRSQDNNSTGVQRILSGKDATSGCATGSTGGSQIGLQPRQSADSSTAPVTAGSTARTASDAHSSAGGHSSGGRDSAGFGAAGNPQKTAGRAALAVLQNLLRTSSSREGTPNQQQQQQRQQQQQQEDGIDGGADSRDRDQLHHLLCSDQILAAAQPLPEQQQQPRVKSGLLGRVLPVEIPLTSSGKVIIEGAAPAAAAASASAASLQGQDDNGDWEIDNMKTWLIQEYCDSSTLAKMSNSWLPANEGDTQMLKRLLLLQDVVRGLSYLHGKNVVHGDLNARNVLITSSPGSLCGFTAKLADLGLSRTVKQNQTHHSTCTVGTMSHMPPELLRYGHMSTSVDIYSLGIMMWELYAREVAFRELHYGQFFETVVLRDLRPKVPTGMPDDYRLLMERCWATDPVDRPSSKTLLECIGLMIADRQQCLGLAPSQDLGSSGSADGAGGNAVTGAATGGGGGGSGGGDIDVVGAL